MQASESWLACRLSLAEGRVFSGVRHWWEPKSQEVGEEGGYTDLNTVTTRMFFRYDGRRLLSFELVWTVMVEGHSQSHNHTVFLDHNLRKGEPKRIEPRSTGNVSEVHFASPQVTADTRLIES